MLDILLYVLLSVTIVMAIIMTVEYYRLINKYNRIIGEKSAKEAKADAFESFNNLLIEKTRNQQIEIIKLKNKINKLKLGDKNE